MRISPEPVIGIGICNCKDVTFNTYKSFTLIYLFFEV